MYNILVSAHSGFRWIVLIAIVVAIILGFMNKSNTDANKKNVPALIGMITSHIQLLIGVALFFLSPKVQLGGEMMSNELFRFFTLEHTLMMLIGIVVITIGHGKAKRKATFGEANKTVAVFYLIGLFLILSRIPWPSNALLGAGWF